MRKTISTIGLGLAITAGLQAEVKKDGLLFAMPLNGNLETVSADGARKNNAKFTRKGNASQQDLSQVKTNIPRYYKFNGVNGLLVENGTNTWGHAERGAFNMFSAVTAACDKPEALKALNGATIKPVKGMQNGAALEISPKKAGACATATGKILTGEPYIASFYAMGPAKIQATVTTIHKDGSKKVRATKVFSLNKTWQRYNVNFKDPKVKVGSYKKATNPAVKAELTIKSVDIKPFKLDALMLEQCGVYYGRILPSTWIAGDSKRNSETLLVPMPVTKLDSGTISMKFIPTSRGGWGTLVHSGNGWKPVLQIATKRNCTRLQVQAFGTTFYKDYRMESRKASIYNFDLD